MVSQIIVLALAIKLMVTLMDVGGVELVAASSVLIGLMNFGIGSGFGCAAVLLSVLGLSC